MKRNASYYSPDVFQRTTARRLSFGGKISAPKYGSASFTYDSSETGGSALRQALSAGSKSGGFIKTQSRVKYGKRSRATNLGVVTVVEIGGIVDGGANTASAGNTVSVGHCQFPPQLAHLMFWRAMIKKLAVACKMNVYNFELGLNAPIGSIFQCFYRRTPTSALTPHTYTIAALTDSLETVAQNFFNFFDALDDAEDLELFSIIYASKTNALGDLQVFSDGSLFLQNGTFTLFSKSTLKIQNRTIAADGDDEEDVNNIPLYGKAFYGKGSGTSGITNDQTVSGGPAVGFWCDALNGTLAKVPPEKWYQEIPQASHFRNVITTGKVHLEPGYIKTSVLDGKITVSLNKMYRILFRPDDSVNTHAKAIMGRFRFIMLEKMINAVAGTAANSIKIGYEHNLRIGGYVTLKRNSETAQMNNVALLDNDV